MVASLTNQNDLNSEHRAVSWQAPSGHVVLDAGAIVTAVDDTAVTLLGQSEAELLGQPWSALTLNGRQDHLLITTTPLTHSNGRQEHLVTLTPRQTTVDLAAPLSLTQRLAGIGLLTASVTHEINNPISIITTACGNLQHEVEHQQLSEDNLKRYLDMIESSAWRCARILNVLRQYSHEDEPRRAVTDLNTIVRDALVLLQHQFKLQYRVEIETDLNEKLRSTVCDHNRITQVLINLLTNARDAMPHGGKIVVKTDTLPGFFTDEAAGRALDGMVITVSDDGSGLTEAVMAQLFTPFFTTKANAAGLGLFVAQQIVANHNGRLWAENKPDGGAVFTLVLPPRQL